MATLKQQVSRTWGWDPRNIKESIPSVELSRGDFLTFVKRDSAFYGWAPKYVLILGVKLEGYKKSVPNEKDVPYYSYIAKISDYTKPSEFSNHRISKVQMRVFERCTYKKSIKMVLKNL